MGGDHAPHSNLQGALLASQSLLNGEKIVLIGDKKLALQFFENKNIDFSIFDFIHAD